MVSITDVSSPTAGFVCGLHPKYAGYPYTYGICLFSLQFALLQWLNMLTSAASQKDGSACLGPLKLDSLEQDQEVAGVSIQH